MSKPTIINSETAAAENEGKLRAQQDRLTTALAQALEREAVNFELKDADDADKEKGRFTAHARKGLKRILAEHAGNEAK